VTRKRKRQPITFAWRDRVTATPWGRDAGTPSRSTVMAVALVLESHADPDGGNVCPAIATIAREAGTNRNGVVEVINALIDRELLRRDGKARKGVIRYRLKLPDPDDAGAISTDSSTPSSTEAATQPTTNHPLEGGGGGTAASAAPPAAAGASPPIAPDLLSATLTTIDKIQALLDARKRPSTQEAPRLKRYDARLRQIIAAKIGTGWAPDDLASEATCDLPGDEKKISSITALTSHLIDKLPDQPDPRLSAAATAPAIDFAAAEANAATEARAQCAEWGPNLKPLELDSHIAWRVQFLICDQIAALVAPGQPPDLHDQISDAVCTMGERVFSERGREDDLVHVIYLAELRNDLLRRIRTEAAAGRRVGPFVEADLPTEQKGRRQETEIEEPIRTTLDMEESGDHFEPDAYWIDPVKARALARALILQRDALTAGDAAAREQAAVAQVRLEVDRTTAAANPQPTPDPTPDPTPAKQAWADDFWA
jgi:hypothetical protein